jgi:hypothetical protein
MTTDYVKCDVAEGGKIMLKCNSRGVCHFYRDLILWKWMCILITIIQMQSYGVWQSKVRISAGIPWHEKVFLTSTQDGSTWWVSCCSCFVTAVFILWAVITQYLFRICGWCTTWIFKVFCSWSVTHDLLLIMATAFPAWLVTLSANALIEWHYVLHAASWMVW